jgi:hypothetical protein
VGSAGTVPAGGKDDDPGISGISQGGQGAALTSARSMAGSAHGAATPTRVNANSISDSAVDPWTGMAPGFFYGFGIIWLGVQVGSKLEGPSFRLRI